jgi:hypothetical protein
MKHASLFAFSSPFDTHLVRNYRIKEGQLARLHSKLSVPHDVWYNDIHTQNKVKKGDIISSACLTHSAAEG